MGIIECLLLYGKLFVPLYPISKVKNNYSFESIYDIKLINREIYIERLKRVKNSPDIRFVSLHSKKYKHGIHH